MAKSSELIHSEGTPITFLWHTQIYPCPAQSKHPVFCCLKSTDVSPHTRSSETHTNMLRKYSQKNTHTHTHTRAHTDTHTRTHAHTHTLTDRQGIPGLINAQIPHFPLRRETGVVGGLPVEMVQAHDGGQRHHPHAHTHRVWPYDNGGNGVVFAFGRPK